MKSKKRDYFRSRMESNSEGKWSLLIKIMYKFLKILANKIHMTKDTKELLDKTRRFLIEKRGTMHIKVSNFNINPFSNILFL